MIVSDIAKHLGEVILREVEPFSIHCRKLDLELFEDDIYLGKVKGVDVHVTLRWDHVKTKTAARDSAKED